MYKSTESKKDFKAVDNLNVAINQGECFGLLGVNGAGFHYYVIFIKNYLF